MNLRKIFMSICCIMSLVSCVGPRLTAEQKVVKAAHVAQLVQEKVSARHFTIMVNYMYPFRGPSQPLTDRWSLAVDNDTVSSYLPYFGVSYRQPYGGGKGLHFEGPIHEMQIDNSKKTFVQVSFITNNDAENLMYLIDVYDNGTAEIAVRSENSDPIRFSGELWLDQ